MDLISRLTENVVGNIASNVVWIILVWAINRLFSGGFGKFNNQSIRKKVIQYFLELELSSKFLLFTLLCGTVAAIAFQLNFLAFLVVVLGTYVFVIFKWTKKFGYAGIASVDSSVANGVDYQTSLRLVTQRFDFMGTGAVKLTSTDEFEQALMRCNHAQTPIRLLLAKPSSPLLKTAAKQYDTSPDDYAHKVMQSLRKLADFKVRRSFNIEVRFHRDESESFRLMFIDEGICLVSVNYYGKGDGRNFPQLVFTNNKVSGGFYVPLQQYFESRWQKGERWDPASILAAAEVI